MHICFLTYEYPMTGYPHGGIGTFIKKIAEKLVEKNIRVTVLSVDPSGNKKNDTIVEHGLFKVIYQRQSKWPAFTFLDFVWRFHRYIKKIHSQHPIDIIEGHELSFAMIKKIPGIAYVIRMHGGHHFFTEAEKRPIEKRKAWKEKNSFSKADALIAVSNYTNIRTAQYLDYDPTQTAIIPNGIDISKFIPGKATDIVPGRIVFAGSVIEKKGIRQLVMALPLVKKKFPAAHLLVLGNTSIKHLQTGEPYFDYLQKFIDPSLRDAIEFIGFVDNDRLQGYIRTAELCVFPSHMETQGIVAAEAMVMEKTVIFGKDGPGPDVIQHKVTGLLCDPHSPEDIAARIIEALSNPSASREMARMARAVALARYDAEVLASINIDFYEKVIARKKMHP
jgi:glycosyltransferase involved in cell wall biosynthesis